MYRYRLMFACATPTQECVRGCIACVAPALSLSFNISVQSPHCAVARVFSALSYARLPIPMSLLEQRWTFV